jgi:hypothetical protein
LLMPSWQRVRSTPRWHNAPPWCLSVEGLLAKVRDLLGTLIVSVACNAAALDICVIFQTSWI